MGFLERNQSGFFSALEEVEVYRSSFNFNRFWQAHQVKWLDPRPTVIEIKEILLV